VRIGTWNVEYAWPARLDALRGVLSANRADIWVLTETHDHLQPPDCEFVAHTEPRPKTWSGIRAGSRWVSIWSRFPIIANVTLPTADKERTVALLLDIGQPNSLLVYGTVMPWKGDREKQDWSEHHRVVPDQCAEWRELTQRHPGAAFCVAGDFNTDMRTGSYYGTKKGIALLREGLADCGLFCATEMPRVPAGLLQNPPIDHIAVPSAWESYTSVVSAWPSQKGVLSDHSGVVIEVAEHRTSRQEAEPTATPDSAGT
jgi:exonuclease III